MAAKANPDPPASPRTVRLRVFIDAEVLFAGATAPQEYGASLVLLRMAELTLLEAAASEQVIIAAERNLARKIPAAIPAFHMWVSRCSQRVPDPQGSDLAPFRGLAEQKDFPSLVAAIQSGCSFLATFNIRHYQPGSSLVQVLRSGELGLRPRDHLARLSCKE